MFTTQTITPIIKERFSVRVYQETPIPDDIQKEFQSRLDTIHKRPLGSPVRLKLLAATPEDTQALRGIGTYGTIKNPTGFIVGAVEAGKFAMEDYGYTMEEAVLMATALGLGTCWVGGLFTQSGFAQKVGKFEHEIIPAVTATGFAAEDLRVQDRSQQLVRTHQRQAWASLFFDGKFGKPLSQEDAGPYQEALEMLRIGPSASNKQPWRVIRDGTQWYFYCLRTPGYGKGTLLFTLLRLADLQRLDVGIAMCHFEMTAREQGLSGSWTVRDPGLAPVDKNTVYVATWNEA